MRTRGATDVETREIATLRHVLRTVSVAALIGLLALVATIGSALQQRGDTRQSIEKNRELLESVRRLEEITAASVDDHRNRNEILHACIVDLALSLADPGRDRSKPIANPCPEALTEAETNG